MAEDVDYFSNHALKLRFPWRLYHGPIVTALRMAVARTPGLNILNVGSGPFFELNLLPRDERKYTVCDIDPRAVDLARTLHGSRLAGADVMSDSGKLPYADARFDLVVSMDVIEHVPDPVPWVAELVRVLRPSGRIFLTTPNYGFSSLGLIERTALEGVARVQGFSRTHIHPSKMTATKLRTALHDAGVRNASVRSIAFGWVLVASGER
jgi:SAM-dependent methyltransferase